MIKDRKHFEQFIEKLPALRLDEVTFVSMSARNKYLSMEDRLKYDLGRTEMFGREVVFENTIESHELVMKKLDTVRSWRKTKNGSDIPDKCLVTYMNLNPSHTVRAMGAFIREMNTELFNYNENLVSGNDVKGNLKRFKNARSVYNTELQKSSSRKLFVDIDIDCTHEDILNTAMKVLDAHECKYFVIKSQGGWHIPVLRESLTKLNEKGKRTGFNYVEGVVDYCNKIIKNSDKYEGEVENNKNLMVPVPGTLQAGKLVEFVCSNY